MQVPPAQKCRSPILHIRRRQPAAPLGPPRRGPGVRRPEPDKEPPAAEGRGRGVEEGRPAGGVVEERRRRRRRRGGGSSSSNRCRCRRRRSLPPVERGRRADPASSSCSSSRPRGGRQDLPEPFHRRPGGDTAERVQGNPAGGGLVAVPRLSPFPSSSLFRRRRFRRRRRRCSSFPCSAASGQAGERHRRDPGLWDPVDDRVLLVGGGVLGRGRVRWGRGGSSSSSRSGGRR